MAPLRPQPAFPENDTQPFWDATKKHELTYQTCDRCNEVIFYPRRHCTSCGSDQNTWHVSQVMQSRHPAFKDLGAYAVAYVDLDEGFRIMTNIVGIQDPTTDIQCGMRVKLRWEDQGDGEVSLPMFEPA